MNLYICDAVKSPFILGIIRPRIYLPSALSEKELSYITAHETAHLNRKDHWWKSLGYLLLCIYWFNPLCWAAYAMFCKDIELACDERTIKTMTFQEKKEYSKTLLNCAQQKSLVIVCPLAFGEIGIKERVQSVLHYRKPAFWVILISTAACLVTAACFFMTSPKTFQIKVVLPTDGTEHLLQKHLSAANQWNENDKLELSDPVEEEPAQNIILHEQPETDQVCIKVQPSMLREQNFYYYIPTDADQEWLSGQMKALDLKGEPFDRRWEGHHEAGWQIVYQDMELRVFEGGYLYDTYNDAESGRLMECLIEAPKLCDYIQIMLIEKAGYQRNDISAIKEIVSARLEVHSAITIDGEYHSQTITDTETLQKFEEWFHNAEYILPGTDCGNNHACLELAMADGNMVRLSMATDNCINFSLDGVTYDYHPVSDGWDNHELFKCFDEIALKY